MEHSRGLSGNNLLTVLMKANGTSLQETASYVAVYWQKLMDGFLDTKTMLPSWGEETDAAVATYVSGLESWISGNLYWSFDTQRYFGAEHKEVERTLIVSF
jgi:hypothetical protein